MVFIMYTILVCHCLQLIWMRYSRRTRKMGFLAAFSDPISKTVIQQYSVFKAVSTIQESVLPRNTNSCCVGFSMRISSCVFCGSFILQRVLWLHLFLNKHSVECLFTFAKWQFYCHSLLNFLLRKAVDDIRKADSLLCFTKLEFQVLFFFSHNVSFCWVVQK